MADRELSQMVESPTDLSARLNLPFKDHSLLLRALTHRSYLNENNDAVEDNERLEFLGDAVLDFLVGAWLYNRFPEMAEGRLTRLRSALVGTTQLARFSADLGFGEAVLLGKGEEEGGGRRRKTILCAVFEAVVGALYLDSGLEAVQNLVHPLLEPVTEAILFNQQDRDAKSRLQEWAQSQGYGVPIYREVSRTGPDHRRTYEFEVYVASRSMGRGAGPNKQAASKAAASEALRALGL